MDLVQFHSVTQEIALHVINGAIEITGITELVYGPSPLYTSHASNCCVKREISLSVH